MLFQSLEQKPEMITHLTVMLRSVMANRKRMFPVKLPYCTYMNSICPSVKVCYSHREPQRVQTLACQEWPILCRSSWQHCPPASDPNIFQHLGRRSGSTSGYGFLQTLAAELCEMERRQRGEKARGQ